MAIHERTSRKAPGKEQNSWAFRDFSRGCPEGIWVRPETLQSISREQKRITGQAIWGLLRWFVMSGHPSAEILRRQWVSCQRFGRCAKGTKEQRNKRQCLSFLWDACLLPGMLDAAALPNVDIGWMRGLQQQACVLFVGVALIFESSTAF